LRLGLWLWRVRLLLWLWRVRRLLLVWTGRRVALLVRLGRRRYRFRTNRRKALRRALPVLRTVGAFRIRWRHFAAALGTDPGEHCLVLTLA